MSKMVAGGLSVFAGLLLITLYLEYRAFQDESLTTATPSPSSSTTKTDNAMTLTDRSQDWVATILDRPLFKVSRRPPPGSAAGISRGTGLPRLSGTLVTSSQRSAIFAGPGGAKPVVIAEGAKLGSYTVQSIGAGRVVLIGPDGPVMLKPSFDTAPVAAMAAIAEPSLLIPAAQADRQSLLDRVRNGPVAAERPSQ
jgi:hypothetical protein